MALVNQAKREINAKIVFFGPAQAGKATSLKHVFNKLKPEFRGAMKVMNVQDARMLFFDFTPPGDGNVDGYKVRFHLYTVSGSNVDPAAWKMVLKGVDGVVFVADSAPQQQEQNRRSMDDLVSFLKGYGQNLVSVPTVLQLNKSDLPDAAAVADLERSLNPSRLPSFRASSQNGDGVLQALMSLVKTVLAGFKSTGAEELAGSEGLERAVEEPVAPPAAPQPSLARAQEPPAAAAEEEPLSLELSGAPTAAGGDVISVPLTIRSGSRSKQVVLTLSLAVEKG
uniref:GTP-binding protein n=1 Tax=Geobacter sp. (strain M21) TaxID=443144 RepID=C6E795_GEOSM